MVTKVCTEPEALLLPALTSTKLQCLCEMAFTPQGQSEMDGQLLQRLSDFHDHSTLIDVSLAAVSSLIDLRLQFDRRPQTKELQQL